MGGGSSSQYVKDLVNLVEDLTKNDIRYIVVNNYDIQIEK